MLGIEYSPCYHCDKTKCSFCELTRYRDSQQKKEASEMAEIAVEEYRKKHKRCRTCAHANESWGVAICKAKNIPLGYSLRYCGTKGMFCKLYQAKAVSEDGKAD
jgi:hypothetical protein